MLRPHRALKELLGCCRAALFSFFFFAAVGMLSPPRGEAGKNAAQRPDRERAGFRVRRGEATLKNLPATPHPDGRGEEGKIPGHTKTGGGKRLSSLMLGRLSGPEIGKRPPPRRTRATGEREKFPGT